MAERAGDPRAEQLYREAIERFVDAFLVDRAGHAVCFTDAHAIGRHVAERYGCPMKDAGDGYWTAGCGVLALHRRLGASWAGPTVGRCSVRGAGDLECDHVPGRWYDGVHCHRIVYEADFCDISLVPFPDDPRTYRMEVARTPREIRAARGRPLRRGEVPLCTHCTEGCDGADAVRAKRTSTSRSGRRRRSAGRVTRELRAASSIRPAPARSVSRARFRR